MTHTSVLLILTVWCVVAVLGSLVIGRAMAAGSLPDVADPEPPGQKTEHAAGRHHPPGLAA